jgi:hypothetical protein
MTYSCKPDDDDLVSASFPINPDVFIDDFSGGLEYAAFGGSDVAGFDLDFEETYNGTEASMKFSVPDFNAAEGTFVGGVFFASGGRDLRGFTALTFYAKATRSANIDVIGFGVSPAGSPAKDDFEVSVANLAINTNWKKYYIPIPDPSKLNAEEALLYYAEGPENEEGYTFWLDEVKYENIGLIAQPKATMMGGQNVVQLAYQGVNVSIENVTYQVNLPNGVNQMYNLTINYFDLVSSNESVVQIGQNNEINVVGPGLALIRGFVNGVEAEGTLTLNVQGGFVPAPIPTFNAANVISLFSDAYTNVQVDFYNGFWEPFQTTESNDFAIGNDNILNYTNFNFVGTQFSNPTINASNMTHIHFDVFIPGAVQPGTNLNIILRDFGADGADGGSDDSNLSVDFTSTDLVQGAWNRLDIPLSTLTNTSNMGLIIYEGADLPNIFVDNIFFYN